jgi:DNA-directed RNA polymerase specialized sigma24 family protein
MNSQASTDFSRLIERIKGGDERALEKLLAAFAIPLRRMAAQFIGSSLQPHLDAEDLVQRVSMILWRGLREGKFKLAEPKQLTSLAKTLLRRQAARAVQRLKPALELGATYEGDLSATLSDRPMIGANSVTEKVEKADQIRNLMNRVHGVDRWMLELLMEGNSIAGTARILGAEPAALRMRLSRLRVRLRKDCPQSQS